MKCFKIITLVSVFFIFSCHKSNNIEPFKLIQNKQEKLSHFSFVSMGCPWVVYYSHGKSSVRHNKLKQKIIAKVAEYYETFSDWSADSELSKLEKMGFEVDYCCSDLFFQGLKQAKNLYDTTHGVFDISLGDGDFSSLSFNPSKNCFSFEKQTPKKLTFNGFIKGMVLADLAKIFIRSGIHSFYVNAGNGNLIYKVEQNKRDLFDLSYLIFPKGDSPVYFLSQSRTMQNLSNKERQHIFDPRKKIRVIEEDIRVLCTAGIKEMSKWHEVASYADAYSTALTIDPNLNLPSYCQKL